MMSVLWGFTHRHTYLNTGDWETALKLIKIDEIHCNDVSWLPNETLVVMGGLVRLKCSILPE